MLAAERFADSTKVEMGIKIGVNLMFYDLQKGVDGFTGRNITKIDLAPQSVVIFSMCVEDALRSCARQSA